MFNNGLCFSYSLPCINRFFFYSIALIGEFILLKEWETLHYVNDSDLMVFVQSLTAVISRQYVN